MKPSSFRSLKCIVTAWMLGGCSLLPAKADEPADAESALAGIEYFETHVRPLLEKHCYECHSESSRPVQGGLRLDDRQLTRRGGDSGPAVVPEDLDASLMLSALRYEDYEMPPNGQLSAAEIAAIEQWIRMGAPDPRRSSADPADEANSDQDALSRWAYVTPRRHPRPQVTRVGWPTTTIDWFVLQQMESMELSPAREADRRTLIRRATYDLIGLPPNPDRVDAFVQDESPQAYERLVDELLASPQYGERWTRLWLDVARYAEDQAHIVGDDRSLCYPNAYLYRDWVIGALNADVPYDEFVTQQLAADLLPDNERNHAALGFLGLGPKYYNRGSAEVKADEWDDRIDTVTRGLLGLTAACARCHDHKFDPITMRDYYALAGVFASTRMYNCALDATRKSKDDGNTEKPEDAMHIVREGKPTDVAIAIRGDVKKRGPVVPRGFLAVLHDGHSRIFVDGSGRLELARAITDPANPLTARVLVNRAWAAHFGRGIVATPSNFGQMGQTPTHPELLDDLATRFVEQGWSLKWLHREIVLSSTYRQSSTASAEQQAKDPNNVWLSRMHRRRLDIEQWRDAMLAVTNRLDERLGGASIDPASPESRRRTVYAEVSRFELSSLLAKFDFPDPNAHAPARSSTTTPLQKLFMMNSPFVTRVAAAMDGRADGSIAPEELDDDVVHVYRTLYGRTPVGEELAIARGFLGAEGEGVTVSSDRWQEFVQALLMANEMFFVD